MDSKKISQYKNMIVKLELLVKQKNQLDFTIKKLKQNIDEFESNHLGHELDKILDEFKKNGYIE